MRRALLFVFMLLFTTPLLADDHDQVREARNGGDRVQLLPAACTHEAVLQRIMPTVQDLYRAAVATVDGQGFAACWRRLNGSTVHLIYEDGDQGMVPWREFQLLPSA
jgi:hypothetical protein